MAVLPQHQEGTTMLERFREFDGADQIGLFDEGQPNLLARFVARIALLFR
ncbi:MAG: hypothetical protein AB7S80_12395 [Rhizobiaceae bacterium]